MQPGLAHVLFIFVAVPEPRIAEPEDFPQYTFTGRL
jgi:hypothetical protein